MRPLSQAAPTSPSEHRGFGLQNGCRPTRDGQATLLFNVAHIGRSLRERLGRASVGSTLDAHKDVMPGMQEEEINAGLGAAPAG